MAEIFEILVPATTANLGPGFDCLGLALKLYNRVVVSPANETRVSIDGHGRDELPRDAGNLMLRSARELAQRSGKALPPLAWDAHHDVPLARGLGSSSTAIVAGLLAANTVLGLGLPRDELVRVAAGIEGHPDNVAPALLGGLTLCLPDSDPLVVERLNPHPALQVVLLVPQFQISTCAARQVLPAQVPRADAVFNLARAAAMVAALVEGRWALLGEATKDRLHQPYRLPLMPGVAEAMEAARAAGAQGVAVSGSGPSVAAFCTGGAGAIALAMIRAARSCAVDTTVTVAQIEPAGARIVRRSG